MKNLIFLSTIFLFTLVLSCSDPIDQKLVLGNWTAVEFLENKTPKEVDLNSINFSFYENNTYTYQGIMNLEAGSYYLKGNLLYTTDTLSDQRIEKSVKVIKSTSDSLFFKMNLGGVSQTIKLLKTD